ncbi:MAG: glycosyltransferase family 9 protein [Fibrobacter sp.]|nr:glycosyltransferase family 9 protein [Fibrobacter sp.]
MGDVILASSLLDVLKRSYPDAGVTFLTDSKYVELFRDDPRIMSVQGSRKNERDVTETLAAEEWDLIIDLQNSGRSRKLTRKLASRSGIHRFNKLHLKRFLLLFCRLNFYSGDDTVLKRYISASGQKDDGEIAPRLYFNSPLPPRLKEMLQSGNVERPAIALFPFSAWRNKEWPEEYFIDVGRYFLFKGWEVFIMGGPDERERAEALRSGIGQKCISFAGKVSLYECGCILNVCSLAIGNDTGLAHLARACGVKTGIIFGPTTRQFGFFPSGLPEYRVFQTSLCCRPCHAHGGNLCLRWDKACMRRIGPDEVINGLIELSQTNNQMHPCYT